jgi:hypothetical protein
MNAETHQFPTIQQQAQFVLATDERRQCPRRRDR